MGEYASFNGQSIKIGTCEQMYYLRADQVHFIQPKSGNVNPRRIEDAQSIRFRFPFPQEDGTEPGAFADYDYGFGLHGVEPPSDPEAVEHYSVNFSNKGLMLSIPCPRSAAGKASGLKIGYNGYAGPVHIHSQRLVGNQLVLVLRCGDCGALYRVPTLDDAQPVLDALEKQAVEADRQNVLDEQHHETKMTSRGEFYREIARRIVDGYTGPNFWHNNKVEAIAV